MKRESYYKEMVQGLLDRYYHTKIDLAKSSEVPLPNVRTDMVFGIAKWKIEKYASSSPLPYLAEENLVELKALNDHLTVQDVMAYLGKLMVRAEDAEKNKRSIALTIFSAEELPKSFLEKTYHPRKSTDYHWLERIEAQYPAYLFIIERLPFEQQEYWKFLPFVPLKVLVKHKRAIHQIVKEAREDPESGQVLLCLSKLQPEFYKKEVKMILQDNKDVASDFFPKAVRQAKTEGELKGKADAILQFLEARFGKVSKEIREQVKACEDLKKLNSLATLAAKAKDLEEFKKRLS